MNTNCLNINNRRLTAVDVFAGAGGFSRAAINLGIEIRAAVELNPHACYTYRENIAKFHPRLRLHESNILDLPPEKIVQESFIEGEQCDILLGGPPCQGFSVHRIKNAGIDDPRNSLVLRYFQFIAALRPKVFLMENVPGMLWKRHEKYLHDFYTAGSKAGYEIQSPVVLDARDYGVPQRRKRVFVLGVRNDVLHDIAWPPRPTHCNPSKQGNNPDLLPWRTAQDIFNMPLPANDPNNVHMNHSHQMVKRLKEVPLNGGSRKDASWLLPCHKNHNGHKDVYGRIDPLQPGPTMTTACINPSKGRFVHPTEPHGITVRQAARFQTFPDDFVFYGGLIASGVQVGNAVPVKLGETLLNEIKNGLLERQG